MASLKTTTAYRQELVDHIGHKQHIIARLATVSKWREARLPLRQPQQQ